jgi:energy-coupling factor transporter ATP-binding protein EcfA2
MSHLVLGEVVLDEIGPAINGGQSIFIYGSPGNGKTTIANALWGLIDGDVEIPHAIEVEGSIIRIFDPATHQERRSVDDDRLTIGAVVTKDRRWATCRRPLVKAGGELMLTSLDLAYDPRAGYYRAPLQLAANGGMLLVDDFGRQRCEPRDLLNRWMVPLESGTDYLTLQSGLTFEVPFSVFVAFATNIRPSELVDEAFFCAACVTRCTRRARRPQISSESSSNAARNGRCASIARSSESLLDGLLFTSHGVALRACQPRDLIQPGPATALYRGVPRELTPELLESACVAYFVDDRQ